MNFQTDLNLKEYDEMIELLDHVRADVEAGQLISILILSERVDGDLQGGCTSIQNAFAVAGYMLTWALHRIGFVRHENIGEDRT